jgi:hypothetical protein
MAVAPGIVKTAMMLQPDEEIQPGKYSVRP